MDRGERFGGGDGGHPELEKAELPTENQRLRPRRSRLGAEIASGGVVGGEDRSNQKDDLSVCIEDSQALHVTRYKRTLIETWRTSSSSMQTFTHRHLEYIQVISSPLFDTGILC